jgi:hypothetical protein
MRYIANILTNRKFTDNELYNIVENKENLIENIPTLVIGWEYTKKLFKNANILNWEIDENTFWTYGNRERRSKYEENVDKFKKLALKRMIKSINYEFFNILIATEEEKKEFCNLITNHTTNVHINNDILYVLKPNTNDVIGISLRDIDYIEKDRKKILSKVFKNTSNNIISLTDVNLSYDIKNTLYKYSYTIPYLFGEQ